jgi:hypothetical protein
MAVRFGAALGAVMLTGASCGGTLEGKYRRGEIGPGGSTTTTTGAGPGTPGAGAAEEPPP